MSGRGGGGPRRRGWDRDPHPDRHQQQQQQQGGRPAREARSGDSSRPRRGVRYLKWYEITQMAAGTSEEVVKVLLSNEAGFLNVFSHGDSCGNPRILKALIKIV